MSLARLVVVADAVEGGGIGRGAAPGDPTSSCLRVRGQFSDSDHELQARQVKHELRTVLAGQRKA